MINKIDEIQKSDTKKKNLPRWIGGTFPLTVYAVIFVTVIILVIFKFRNSIF